MRQTAHLYMATAVAAVVMCCSLPYATRANLDHSFKPEGTTLRGYEMPAAAPIQFVGFPRAFDLEGKIPSIDLSVTTLQGFIALSKNLGTEAQWTDAS